jgi:hypothetical protein
MYIHALNRQSENCSFTQLEVREEFTNLYPSGTSIDRRYQVAGRPVPDDMGIIY